MKRGEKERREEIIMVKKENRENVIKRERKEKKEEVRMINEGQGR